MTNMMSISYSRSFVVVKEVPFIYSLTTRWRGRVGNIGMLVFKVIKRLCYISLKTWHNVNQRYVILNRGITCQSIIQKHSILLVILDVFVILCYCIYCELVYAMVIFGLDLVQIPFTTLVWEHALPLCPSLDL